MTFQRELAAKLLKSVAEELEATLHTHRSCNTLLARFAGDAALILQFDELTPRFSRLLKRSRWEGFYGGLMTNLGLPWFVPKRMRQLTPLERINSDHPEFNEAFAIETFTKYYPEMLPCLDTGFDSWIHAAKTELAVEEVALSQAILGRYDDAIRTARCLNESHRQNNVRFVIAIEQLRQGSCQNAQSITAALDEGTLTGWGAAQFALGICNRVPWRPYPYPDY